MGTTLDGLLSDGAMYTAQNAFAKCALDAVDGDTVRVRFAVLTSHDTVKYFTGPYRMTATGLRKAPRHNAIVALLPGLHGRIAKAMAPEADDEWYRSPSPTWDALRVQLSTDRCLQVHSTAPAGGFGISACGFVRDIAHASEVASQMCERCGLVGELPAIASPARATLAP